MLRRIGMSWISWVVMRGSLARFAGRVAAIQLSALAALLAFALPAIAQDVMRGHGGPVRALAVSAAARELVSGSFDSTVIVWDLNRNVSKRVLRLHEGPVSAVAALADGCLASAGDDRLVGVWCGTSAAPRYVLRGHEGPVTALGSTASGLVSAGQDGSVRFWRTDNGVGTTVVATFQVPVTAMAVARSGAIIAATADGRLRKLVLSPDGSSAAQTNQTPGQAAAIGRLAVTGDDEIVTASADGLIRLYGYDLTPAAEIEIDGTPLSSLALSPDGKLIATAGLRGGIAIVDRASRRIIHHLTGPGLPVWSLVFDSDNRTLISGGADRVIRRWDAVAGKALSSNLPERDVVAEAAASGERGAVVFRACQACHTLSPDDGNRAGPTLHGIFGRRIGTASGYAYSEALPRMTIIWSSETIARLFEVGPNTYTPGTKMPEQTITDPADRHALVEWLARVTASK